MPVTNKRDSRDRSMNSVLWAFCFWLSIHPDTGQCCILQRWCSCRAAVRALTPAPTLLLFAEHLRMN